MRSNLEDNLARNLGVRSLRFSVFEKTLTSSFTIDALGPIVYFLEPNGANQDVFLPDFERGRVFYIINTDDTYSLLIYNSDGVLETTMAPLASTWVIGTATSWDLGLADIALNAVRFDRVQSASTSEKLQARENVGLPVLTEAQVWLGQTSDDPVARSLTGDVTIALTGVTAIGANKVTDAMLRQGAARSLIGVTGNATANVADIQGTTDQILRVSGAGTALAFGSIDLSKAAAVGASRLALANLVQGGALSLLGVAGNAGADYADIAAGSDHQVLRRSGVAIAFGSIDLSQSAAVGTSRLALANLAQGGALSLLGVTGNVGADYADISAGTDHQVLRRSGTAIAFGAIALDQAAATSGQLPITGGGTGSSSASAARTALGLAIGTDVQAYNAYLSDLVDFSSVRFPGSYGAVGDGDGVGGGTDDDLALQAALDALDALGGGILDLAWKTYRCDTALTLYGNVEIRNGTIDFTNGSSTGTLLGVTGTLGSNLSLSANADPGDIVISLSAVTGLAADDYIFISSNSTWSSTVSATFGEMARIKSIASLDVTLYAPVEYAYTTASTGKVNKLTFVENIKLVNVTAIGSGTGGNQFGLDFEMTRGVLLDGCEFYKFDNREAQFDRSANVTVRNCRLGRATETGLAYGLTFINGCHWVNVEGNFFENCRHGLSIGGTGGVNRFITASNNTAYGCVEAGLDAHPAADHVSFLNNKIWIDNSVTVDGIIYQGANFICVGNEVYGAQRIGIYHQCATSGSSEPIQSIITNNIVAGGADSFAILVATAETDTLIGVNISNNTVRDYYNAIKLDADTASIAGFSITGNQYYEPTVGGSTVSGVIRLENSTGMTLKHGVINGNVGRSSTTNAAITLAADAAGDIEYVMLTGNSWYGGNYGIRATNTNYINADGNILVGTTTAGVSIAGANSISSDNLV